MTTKNAPPSDALKSMTHADQDRERLRELLLDGAASKATSAIDDSYFSSLKRLVRHSQSE